MTEKDLIDRAEALELLRTAGSWLALHRAIAAIPAVTVGVKPLVWVEGVAETAVGAYRIVKSGEKQRAVFADRDYLRDEHGRLREFYDEDAAKAAAQADFSARTLAALDLTPAPQCCMCGRIGLSTIEGDGGTECELNDGRWVCCGKCYDQAVSLMTPAPDAQAVRDAALREAAEVCAGIRQRTANGPMPEGARFDYEQAILALIGKEGV